MARTFTVIVTSAIAAGVAVVAGQDAVLVERGKDVYTEERCRLCHSIDGEGNRRGSLDGVGSRLTTEEIELWMIDPQAGAGADGPVAAEPNSKQRERW